MFFSFEMNKQWYIQCIGNIELWHNKSLGNMYNLIFFPLHNKCWLHQSTTYLTWWEQLNGGRKLIKPSCQSRDEWASIFGAYFEQCEAPMEITQSWCHCQRYDYILPPWKKSKCADGCAISVSKTWHHLSFGCLLERQSAMPYTCMYLD
jgi:hypothetical protein